VAKTQEAKTKGQPSNETLLYMDAVRELENSLVHWTVDLRLTIKQLNDLRHPGFGFRDEFQTLVRKHLNTIEAKRSQNMAKKGH
jgi:hypothetical protein